MKKCNSLLIIVLILTLVTSTTAHAGNVIENEKTLENTIDKIAQVNNLSDAEKYMLRDSLSEQILNMDKNELKELKESMKTLDKEYHTFLKDNIEDAKLIQDVREVQLQKDYSEGANIQMATRSSNIYVNFVYIGVALAPLTGLQLWCNQGGYDLIEEIVKGGGIAGGMGLMIIKLCASASAVAMATPVAAIIGGVVALNLVSLKIQLMFSPIAHINI